MSNIAVIFAGGTGSRMNTDIPKQFLEVNNKPIIIYTLEYFQNHSEIDKIFISCVEEWIEYLKLQIEKYSISKVIKVIPGGSTGQDSIYRGLKEAEKTCNSDDIVLIHDGVRPFITDDLISRNINDTKLYGTSITCTSCNETFIISKDGSMVDNVPIRKESFNAQAPQAFRLKEIIDAHECIRKTNPNYDNVVDSCTLFNMLNKDTHLTEGVRGNIKITNPVDVYIFRAWLDYKNSNEKVIGLPNLNDYNIQKILK